MKANTNGRQGMEDERLTTTAMLLHQRQCIQVAKFHQRRDETTKQKKQSDNKKVTTTRRHKETTDFSAARWRDDESEGAERDSITLTHQRQSW